MFNEPAVGNRFFGREDILNILAKRVGALKSGYRQNVALTGQALSGKSSILYQFLYTLRDTSIIPIYVEVIEEPFSAFASKYIATMLYNYLRSSSIKAEKNLELLIKTAEPIMPHTVYAIKKVRNELAKKNYNDAYRELFNLTSVLKKETGKSCVVILDEFHNLEFFKIKKPYFHFGKIIMIQKDTMYIVSSSQKNTIKKILSEKLALLYGNFEIIEVLGFNSDAAQAYLSKKFQNITVAKKYANYLIDFCDGNPFYLDLISKKIIEIANLKNTTLINDDTIIEALTLLLYNTSGTINQYFTNNIMSLLEKDLRGDCLDILIALACGFNKLEDIARRLNKKNPAGFAKKLTVLIESDLVYRNGVFYEVQDKVFKFWLRSVYHKKKALLINDILNKATDFKNEVKNDIQGFLRENEKNVTSRIMDLFLEFHGEIVEIARRKRHLPKFLKAEFHKYEKYEDIIVYHKIDKYWICRVSRDKIDESQVADFIERYRPVKEMVTKKICIALEGIDTNALLLAKEKNIWVWDLDNINGLMRLYKRHNLICK